MLGWLPIVGPIIEGIVSAWNKKLDTDVQKKKIDGDVWVKEADLSTQIVLANNTRTEIRFLQSLILTPVCVWTSLIVWDKIIALKYPYLVWGILPIKEDTGISFLPYAAMVYLFGTIALDKWKR
jgi:hypothetical protein